MASGARPAAPVRPAAPEGEARGRRSQLEEVIEELERRFGPRVVYRLSQARPKLWARSVSTGSLGLDAATGVGGVPRGRITAIDGPESSGKTTLAYRVLANAQAEGGLAAFVDAEQSADAEELRRCGVDLAGLILALPTSAVEALAMAEVLARSAALDAVVVSALPRPCSAALLAEGTRRLNVVLAGSPTALVLVGLMGRVRGASSDFASLGLRLRPLRLLGRPGGEIVGLRVRAEVVRNKLARPGGSAELEILDGQSISRGAELLDLGRQCGLIEETSLGPVFEGQPLGLWRARAVASLERDSGLAGRLEAAIRRALGLD